MNLPSHPIRVLLRHSLLAEDASLRALEDLPPEVSTGYTSDQDYMFLQLAKPAPVGSVLGLADESEPEPWAFQVRRVVLGAGEDGWRGCVGRRVDASLLAETDLLDTEHLSPLPIDEVADRFNNPNRRAAESGGGEVVSFQPVGSPIPVTVIPTGRPDSGPKFREARSHSV